MPHIVMSDNASTYLSATWYDGYWERLIELIKAALKRVLCRAHNSLPMLQTLIIEVNDRLNDRTFTYLSEDLKDPEPLTSSYLLYGRRITALPYRSVTNKDMRDSDYGLTDGKMRKNSKRLSLLPKISKHGGDMSV